MAGDMGCGDGPGGTSVLALTLGEYPECLACKVRLWEHLPLLGCRGNKSVCWEPALRKRCRLAPRCRLALPGPPLAKPVLPLSCFDLLMWRLSPGLGHPRPDLSVCEGGSGRRACGARAALLCSFLCRDRDLSPGAPSAPSSRQPVMFLSLKSQGHWPVLVRPRCSRVGTWAVRGLYFWAWHYLAFPS